MTMKPTSIFIFSTFVISTIWCQNTFAAKKQRNWRIGLGRTINTVSYGYDTKGKSSDFTEISKSDAGQFYNTTLVIEYLFGGRKSPALFGFEIDQGTSTGQRNFSLEYSKTKIGDVLQKLSIGTLYGGNIFFSDGGEEGFNWSLGLMTGSATLKTVFKNGDTLISGSSDEGHNFETYQESTQKIPLEIVKIGLEWILETAVFRFEYISTKQTFFGTKNATVVSTDLGMLNSRSERMQKETIEMKGGLGLVVQGRF